MPKILIVDDSSFIILVCRQILEKSGYEVIADSYDGIDAVEKACLLKPDIILMDIALPLQNGIEATKKILQALPNTKILAMSAVNEDWLKDKAIEAGCYAFLAKPFDPEQLIAYIEQSKERELKYG